MFEISWVFLGFHMKSEVGFSIFVNCWNFNGYCVEAVDCFWEDGHFHSINPSDL